MPSVQLAMVGYGTIPYLTERVNKPLNPWMDTPRLPSHKSGSFRPADNRYVWKTYAIPKTPSFGRPSRQPAEKEEVTLLSNRSNSKDIENGDDDNQQTQYLTIRHLKQGSTGAVKTWPTAELLLHYLVRHGGLEKHTSDGISHDTRDVLDLRNTFTNESSHLLPTNTQGDLNVVELGGGSGFLSLGLALSLNRPKEEEKNEDDSSQSDHGRSRSTSSRLRLLCTDHDRATIKNMRYNVANQPPERKIQKSVRVQSLAWSDSIGGPDFSLAVQRMFAPSGRTSNPPSTVQSDDAIGTDPLCLVTHVIASDVHWGESTLDPLSSVVASFKLRNPTVVVILLLQERKPNAVEALRSKIEQKVQKGCQHLASRSIQEALMNFSVSVRPVLHDRDNLANHMKLVEC